MALFRKKPVTVEAVQFTESNLPQIRAMDSGNQILEQTTPGELRINTPEGVMTAHTGDWIIQGVKGELYPCRDDIFQMTYEAPQGNERTSSDVAQIAGKLLQNPESATPHEIKRVAASALTQTRDRN